MWKRWFQSGISADAADEELLPAIASGDETAFLALYKRRQASVYRYALHMSGDADLSADVLQETFLVLLHNAGKLDTARGSVLAWLFAVARNQVLKQSAARRRHLSWDESTHDEPATDNDFAEELAREQLIERIREAVPSLPPVYREVLLLCDLQGMSYEEVATVIECPVGTVRSRLHRARALLAGKIRPLVGYCS